MIQIQTYHLMLTNQLVSRKQNELLDEALCKKDRSIIAFERLFKFKLE
jgi:hypothetical protein